MGCIDARYASPLRKNLDLNCNLKGGRKLIETDTYSACYLARQLICKMRTQVSFADGSQLRKNQNANYRLSPPRKNKRFL